MLSLALLRLRVLQRSSLGYAVVALRSFKIGLMNRFERGTRLQSPQPYVGLAL